MRRCAGRRRRNGESDFFRCLLVDAAEICLLPTCLLGPWCKPFGFRLATLQLRSEQPPSLRRWTLQTPVVV